MATDEFGMQHVSITRVDCSVAQPYRWGCSLELISGQTRSPSAALFIERSTPIRTCETSRFHLDDEDVLCPYPM
jgi:hypothetical protein